MMERRQQIESLFQEALQHPPAERDSWLRNACNGDSGLQREVASLLENYQEGSESWAAAAAAQLISGLQSGHRLGPYEILASIGAGGMGTVYRARDTRLKRDVAIKMCAAQFNERFEREARVVASLNHPNICQIYDVGPNFLVMELVEGENLSGPLPVETVLNYARQIAEALEAAHEKGVVHRDLKPANIKVTPAGLVKVLDFGLAKATEGPAASRDANSPTMTMSATRAGMILGTAAYMSPEQARGSAVDKRADIWAFGCVLYEMLSGRHAFRGETTSDILAAVLKEEPDWSRVPAQVRPLLRRCLVKDPKRRLRDIGDAIPLMESAPEPAPARSRRLWPWVAALVCAFCLAALGWWRATRVQPLRPMIQLTAQLGPGIALDSQSVLALSPDGMQLAFTTRSDDGKRVLAIRNLGDNKVTPLAGTENGDSPFFSPDGHWLGFLAAGELKKISLSGGPAATVRVFPSLRGASWGGGYIVAPMGVATGLFRIPIDGGTPESITVLNRDQGELAHRWPQVLPGGDLVLFTVYHLARYDNSDVEIVSLKTKQRKFIYHGAFFARYLPSGHLVYMHQNTLFGVPFDLRHLKLSGDPQALIQGIANQSDTGANFSFSETGTLAYVGQVPPQRAIFWLDSTGKLQPLLSAPGLYGFPRFSPDGMRLVYTLEDSQGRQDIWLRDLEHNTTSRVTSTAGVNHASVWTPDGRNLIFDLWNRDVTGLYTIASNGAGEARLLAKGNMNPTSMSPDGKWLAIYAPGQGNSVTISMIPVQGDREQLRLGPAKPFIETPYITITPVISPDGRWCAYMSTEPGKEGLWVRALSGPSAGWQIGSRFAFPVWSRKGRELFFLDDHQRIMVVDYSTKGDSFVPGSPRLWSDKRILNLGSPPVYTYDVAPDGKRLAVVLDADGSADEKPVTQVTFLLNFFDELKRRMPAGGN
jgi:serine/threonine-protein kinase